MPVEPIGFDDAVRLAMEEHRQHEVETRWTNASMPTPRRPAGSAFDPTDFPIRDEQRVGLRGAGRGPLRPGPTGRRRRGLVLRRRPLEGPRLDGPSHRRRRPAARPSRSRSTSSSGDAIDFWRVADFVPGRRLLLHAEMKVPGDAWLEFRVEPIGDGGRSELIQTAYFRPMPFWGRSTGTCSTRSTADLPRHGAEHRPGRRVVRDVVADEGRNLTRDRW